MPLLLSLFQAAEPDAFAELAKTLLGEVAKITGEALLVIAILTVIIIALLRWLTMWWLGVTTVVNRLERLGDRLDSIQRAVQSGK